MTLRLPPGISEAEAIAYNKRFEREEGIVIDETARRIVLSGRAREVMARHSPALAEGYSVGSLADLEAAARALDLLREILEAMPAA
jgi:hypothetical protein